MQPHTVTWSDGASCSSLPLLLLRYYKLSVVLLCFLMPMLVPWYFWGESLLVAYFVPAILRYTLVLNATWLVNSAAHMWGNRPYDQGINPSENRFVAFSAIGKEQAKCEGFLVLLNVCLM